MTHRSRSFLPVACVAWLGCQSDAPDPTFSTLDRASQGHSCDWTQWGGAADHGGDSCAQGQTITRELAHVTIDPFVAQETAEEAFPGSDGGISVHYQVPLIDGNDVFVLHKAGTYASCDPPGSGEPFPCGVDNLGAQTWTEQALRWRDGVLEPQWTFVTDWKTPELRAETMFQPVVTQHDIYIPGFGGSVFRVDRHNGHVVARIQPFGPTLDPAIFVWGGLAANRDGDVYYNAVKLDLANPFGDVLGAWIVKVSKHGCVTVADYATINPSAPAADALCYQTFRQAVPRPRFPWPPPPHPDGSPTLPPQVACGHQRAGNNQIPAIGPDGTVFVATHAQAIHGNHFVLALHPDLSLKWAAPLAGHLNDGCGVNAEFECRAGTPIGIEDETNLPPEGRVIDASSASPVALPDGGVLYGAYTGYNNARGHLMRFDRDGAFTGFYTFGWDVTPAVWQHDGTYSVVTKDNVYAFPGGEFYITQLDANLAPEWTHEASNPLTCERQPDGTITCHDDGFNPNGFEWCTNAPVVDAAGHVYVTNGDGNLYVIGQDGNEITHWFLDRTRAASYTPGAIDREGRIYAMNNGELFVLGQ